MRLSVKMVLIFSVMMLASLMFLSSYAADSSVEGANAFTESRYRNMSTTVEREVRQQVFMMEMTLRELTENTTFMSALNQLVRDDSADQKMALSARKSALTQLLQSPLVSSFYSVTFYTREGDFLAVSMGQADAKYRLMPKTNEARASISALPWLDDADSAAHAILLSPHDDILSADQPASIYGLAQRIEYHGKPIGYLEVANQYETLANIMLLVDNPRVCVEMIFDNGQRLFESQESTWTWPESMAQGTLLTVPVGSDGSARTVFHTALEDLGLHLYISQDGSISATADQGIRRSMFQRALFIMLPTFVLIVLVSLGLTRSMTRLTKKVQQFPADTVLRTDDIMTNRLLSVITSSSDRETYELEQVFNQLMIRLQRSAANELSLREGALQAQLSALQTQINPHFIYNTLNIISAKSMESGNFEVIEICDQFAQMLRYSTDTRSRTATIMEEIENVRNYLMLAKTRYEDNLEYTIDMPENMNTITVPKLTLQPLVENALNHGFNGTNVLRKLSITGQIQNHLLTLEIRDNGVGFSEEMLQSLRTRMQEVEAGKMRIDADGGHIGLINTCLRLYYYSHGNMHVSIHNDHGAVITISMPYEPEA